MMAIAGAALAFALVLSLAVRLARRGSSDRTRSRRARRREASSPPSHPPSPVAAVVAVGSWSLAAVWLVGPGPVIGVLVVAMAGMVVRRRASAAARARAARRCLPDLVDLFAIAASAGLPVAAALRVVAPRAPEPLRTSVVAADARTARGMPLDRSLDALGRELGPEGVPLTDALRRSAVTGASLVPLLREVAVGTREARRRSAEEAARRLPITLLLPLVGCVLPAALVLAVVPVLLVSLASFTR